MTKFKIIAFSSFFLLLLFGTQFENVEGFVQQPTLAIPTVTGTPTGPVIRVAGDNDQLNVRSGPNLSYPGVGILIAGEEVNAIGVSIGQDWIQIEYLGVNTGTAWVIARFVFFIKGRLNSLPIIDAPATPTPHSTPTLNATLSAQFDQIIPSTRIPTFTPPEPLVIATFPVSISGSSNQFPTGIIILALFVLGVGGGIISLLRRQ